MLISFRNLFRHGRRSLVAFSAVIFGMSSLLLAGGFINWVYTANRQAVIESRLGHLQITRPGYFERGFANPFAFLLPENDKVIAFVRHLPEVEIVTPRLSISGLISHGEHTISFLGEGVVPDTEARVSRQLAILHGVRLSPQDKDGVILGEGLAGNLGADIGDRVVLIARKPNGGINAVEVTVRGVFQTSTKAFDDYALRVPLGVAQSLLNVSGVHTWVVLLRDTKQTAEVLRRLRAKYPSDDSGPIEFTPWYKLADFYNKTVALFSRQMNVLRAMIAIIVVLSVSNNLVANVFERTGEIGTLLALGFRRRRIVGLFMGEGLLLGILGGILGAVVGWIAAEIISDIGIPMPPAPGMAFGFNAGITVTPRLAVGSFLLVATTTVVASIYPAWRASRLVIIDALRSYR
jgi:putative ABC transport system permease protein